MANLKISLSAQVSAAKLITPSAVPANSVQTETFTLKSLTPEMMLEVACNNLPSGLMLLGASIPAKDQFKLVFWNVTGSTITPSQLTFLIATL